jgi:hypothetical protein
MGLFSFGSGTERSSLIKGAVLSKINPKVFSGFNSLSNANSKHWLGSIPKAWKLKSNRVWSPSQTVECFWDLMILHAAPALPALLTAE